MSNEDAPMVIPAAEPAHQQIVIQPRESMFGRYGKWLFLLIGFLIMGMVGMSAAYKSYFSPPNGPQERYHSLSKTATKKIAILELNGAIMEGDGFVKQQIDRIKKDTDVVGIVLRVSSPGGTVTGSDYIYHHLRELIEDEDRPLPLVVSMGSICASGGYYISMAVGEGEDVVFAEPTTWTGSIGVIIPHYDLSQLLKRFDIENDSIASHRLKQLGSPTRKMTDEARAILQGMVDESFAGFKQIVIDGRPEFKKNPEKLDEVATGQVYTAKQAVANGLVDKIGFIEDAIDRVVELSGHNADKLRCVKYTRPPASLSSLLEANANSSSHTVAGFDMKTIVELTTPRAYFLWSSLPAAMHSAQ